MGVSQYLLVHGNKVAAGEFEFIISIVNVKLEWNEVHHK